MAAFLVLLVLAVLALLVVGVIVAVVVMAVRGSGQTLQVAPVGAPVAAAILATSGWHTAEQFLREQRGLTWRGLTWRG